MAIESMMSQGPDETYESWGRRDQRNYEDSPIRDFVNVLNFIIYFIL